MIAVTGANGLLGSFIVRKLLAEKRPFIAIKRPNSDTSLLSDVASGITWRNTDVTDPVGVKECLDGVTTVIHAAAMVSFNPAHEKKIYTINVEGTKNLVNASLEGNVRRFVHVSSVAALGRQRGQTLITEESKWSDNSVNSTYAESKYLAELEVFRGQEEGLNTVIINPSVILAPADWKKSSAQLFKYVWDEKSFYIDSNLNFVDVRDVCEIALRMIDHQIQGERFVVNGGTLPFLDFFRMIGKNFNRTPPGIKLDSGMLRVAAWLETLRSKLMSKEPLLTVETARLAGTHFRYSSEKIKNLLNFEFQSIDATLAWCCAHYLNFIAKK